MKKQPIKPGARYRDCWMRIWFAVGYDDTTDHWLMRMCDAPYETYFSTEKIQRDFLLISA